MIGLFQHIRTMFGVGLVDTAQQVHGIVLSFLALAWFGPIVAGLFRKLPRSEPEIEWVRLWRCPSCSTFNRRAMTNCTHCEFPFPSGRMARWVPLKVSEAINRNAKRFLRLYKAIGWLLFYGLTVAAVIYLRLYTLHQNPIQELLAAITLGLMLLAGVFFYMALRPRFKSILGAIVDGIAGLTVVGVMLFFALAWNQARILQAPSVAALRTGVNGEVNFTAGDSTVRSVAPQANQMAKLEVQYVVFSWPVLDIYNVTMLRVQKKPLQPDWKLWIYETLSSPVRRSPIWPQCLIFDQILSAPVGGSFVVYGAPTGGLVLRKS